MKDFIKALLLSLAIAATAVVSAACNNDSGSGSGTAAEAPASMSAEESTEKSAAAQTQSAPSDGLWSSAKYTEDTEVGQGAVTVKIKIAAGDRSITITVHTEKDNLGGALVENDLAAGDESEYGLYIKQVNGIEADYDKDGAWWAITKAGEMVNTGADSTPISDGESYELTYTKG